ncbi:MAG TPA: lipocalin family protein [Xanthomonadales bacterium]|nr:lipocalin family protein [Xanthomonadales bacterium]
MKKTLLTAALSISLGACSAQQSPLETVEYVDLERFMGDWYVIAHIPTFLEDTSYNAIERYELDEDGNIPTTFTFNEGGFDGKQKKYEPKGFVTDTESNAVWGMRFVWPIKADYRIIYLDEDYQVTIIGRNKRDYVWLMAREPQIDESTYQDAMDMISAVGYDMSEMRKVPQKW